MNLRTLAVLLLATVTMLSGCVRPRTQVVLVIDADPAMRLRATSVLLEAWSYDDVRGANVLELPARIGADVSWPFQTVLTPLGNDASRRYEVSATALDRDGNRIVVARAISGYTPNETRVLRLFLDTRCESRTCAAADTTCREGLCVDAEILPGSLPTLTAYQTDAGPADAFAPMDAPGPDVYVPPGVDADIDAGVDAGVDAFVEPGTDAFMEPPDAHVLPGTDAFVPMPRGPFRESDRLPTPDISPDMLFSLGWSVAISDGDAVAVGAPGYGDYLYDLALPGVPPERLLDTDCGQSAVINSLGDFLGFGCLVSGSAITWSGPPWTSMDLGLGVGAGLSVAMNETGSVLAFGGRDEIYIGFTSTVTASPILGINVVSLDLNDDGTLLVAGVRNTGLDRDEVLTFTVSGTTITRVGDPIANRGTAVAISGDGSTLVVGENLASRAAVYRRAGGVWDAAFPLNGPAGSLFGISVAVDETGTRIAVGAIASNSTCVGVCVRDCGSCAPTSGGSGAVYVYDGSGALENYIRMPSAAVGNAFGFSVALNRAGTRLVIGAPSPPGGGAVYIVE